jgi:hypothetical protein
MAASAVSISGKYLVKDGRSSSPPVTPWSYPNNLAIVSHKSKGIAIGGLARTYKKSRLPKELIAKLRALPLQPKYFGIPNIVFRYRK